ncbi:hypothetical protein KBI5_08680 [Frankia sp. KB5]|nr:hypothetical protein KBI5_08680 [Frankia sp. KB5]
MLSIAAVALPAVAATEPDPNGTDDVEVHPGWNGMPGVHVIQRVLDATAQLGLVSSVGAVLVGGGMLGVGRVTGSMGSGSRAGGYILGGGGGAFVISVGAKLVSWLIAPATVHSA